MMQYKQLLKDAKDAIIVIKQKEKVANDPDMVKELDRVIGLFTTVEACLDNKDEDKVDFIKDSIVVLGIVKIAEESIA